MALQYVWAPIAILWAIVAITLVSFGIYWLATRRRGLGVALLATGLLLVIVPVASIAWWQTWGSKTPSMSVQALDPAADPLFVVTINHDPQVISDESFDSYAFWDAGDVDHVVDAFQEQHPDGVARIPATLPTDEDVSLWHVSQDDIRFDLYGGQQLGFFDLVTQVASVTDPDGSAILGRVPYPTDYAGAILTTDVSAYSGITWDEFGEFYADITAVSVGDGTITLPMSTGGTVTLVFDEARDTFIATIDN